MSRRFRIIPNRRRGGAQSKESSSFNERASSTSVPGKLQLWRRPRKFVCMSPIIQAVRSDPIAQTINQFTFQVADVPYLFSMASLFEEFKFVSVKVLYKPLISEVVTAHSSVADSHFTVPDLVCSFVPEALTFGTYEEVAQRGDTSVVSTIERWEFFLRPVPQIRGVDSLLTDARVNLGRKWISTTYVDMPHHGFVIAMEPSASIPPSPTFGGRIEFYYSVLFRYPRQPPGSFGSDPVPAIRLLNHAPVEEKEKGRQGNSRGRR